MTSPPRKRVRANPEARRKQILDEAVRLIGERGYYGFGIQELAQRCELTHPGLLHYFGAKEKLLIALLEDRDRRDAEIVASLVGLARQSAEDLQLSRGQVREVLSAIVARNSTQPELVRMYAVLQAEALNAAHPAYDYFLGRESAVLRAFARMLEPHVTDPQTLARQLLAQMLGLEQQWLRVDQAFDLVAVWERAAALLLPDGDTSPALAPASSSRSTKV